MYRNFPYYAYLSHFWVGDTQKIPVSWSFLWTSVNFKVNIYRWLFRAWYVLNPVFCSEIAHLARTTKSCSQRQKLSSTIGTGLVILRYSFCVTFYQWHSVGQLFWMDQKTHSKAQMKWRGVYNCVICINTWRVCQTRAYHSQIFHWKQFATRSFSLFGGDGRLQKFADN